MTTARWMKSGYSNTQTACIEILLPSRSAVRDSKNANGPALRFKGNGLSAFLDKIRSSDRP